MAMFLLSFTKQLKVGGNMSINKNTGAAKAPVTVSVTTTSTEICAANAVRAWAVITNLSAGDVFIAFGRTAILSRGCRLGQNESLKIDASFHTEQTINGIVASGTSNVIVLEADE